MASSKLYCVYILSNHTRTVLYTGITGNLVKRVWQHKNELAEGFTKNTKSMSWFILKHMKILKKLSKEKNRLRIIPEREKKK